MNCMLIECEGDLVVVDAGVTFPGRVHGIDLDHPRLDHALANQQKLRAILITHGHEDHIGALPYLLRELDQPVPVYGPPYALALIRKRLEEHHLDFPEMIATRPGQRFEVGCFDVEPVRVNHSIPDATSLILRTPAGTVVHSGDFKIEERPLDGEHFGTAALQRVRDEGVDLLLSDSTNIDVEGDSGEEADVAEAIDALVAGAEHRVVVAQFASNVYRMKAVFEAARRHGRRVLLLGRSVRNHAAVSRELGLLDGVADLILQDDDARDVPRDQLCVIATGTQGEPPAALSRLARGTHPALELEAGDTVVLSSRIIPGNEKIVFDLTDMLERVGCILHHRKNRPDVHCSGHAARDEQRRYLELCRPKTFIPVHGTFHHLRRHAALAREVGVEQTLVIENGAIVQLERGRLEVVGEATVGRVHIDRGTPVDEELLKERRLIGELGHAVVAFSIGRGDRFLGHVDIVARGFLAAEVEDALLDDASDYVRRDLRRAKGEGPGELEERARRALRRYFYKKLRRKPIVTAMALEVG